MERATAAMTLTGTLLLEMPLALSALQASLGLTSYYRPCLEPTVCTVQCSAALMDKSPGFVHGSSLKPWSSPTSAYN